MHRKGTCIYYGLAVQLLAVIQLVIHPTSRISQIAFDKFHSLPIGYMNNRYGPITNPTLLIYKFEGVVQLGFSKI